jgi:hypothetical protein
MDRVDVAADGAVNAAQWLRTIARRSGADAAAFVKRAARLRACPMVMASWRDGQLPTAHVDAVVHHLNGRTQAIFADQEAALVPTLVPLSVRDTETAMRRWGAYADALVEAPMPYASDRSVYLSPGSDGWGEQTSTCTRLQESSAQNGERATISRRTGRTLGSAP